MTRVASMTVGAWRDLLRARPDAAWDELENAAHRAAGALARARRIRRSDAEDFAQTAWLRLFSRGGADADRAAADAPLDAWVRGVVRHVAAEARRRHTDAALIHEGAVPAPVAAPADQDAPGDGVRPDLVALLDACGATQLQREAFELVVVGRLTCFEAARRLGRDPKSVWERLRRLTGRMAKHVRGDGPPPRDISWVPTAIERARSLGDLRGVRVFELHAAGRTHAEIAAAVGWAVPAVATKVRRARRDARCPATHVPC